MASTSKGTFEVRLTESTSANRPAAAAAHSDDESTIKVATTKKPPKDKDRLSGGTVKLKRPAPKHNKPGNWRDGSVDDSALRKPRA